MFFPSSQQYMYGMNPGVPGTVSAEQQFEMYLNATHQYLLAIEMEFINSPTLLGRLNATKRQHAILGTFINAAPSPWGNNIKHQFERYHLASIDQQLKCICSEIYGPQKDGLEKTDGK